MKKNSQSRAARRTTNGERSIYPAATPDYLKVYIDSQRMAGKLYTQEDLRNHIDTERRAGRLYTLEDVVQMLNDNTRMAVQIVFTAMMEGHVCGASRILRDIDPLVTGMYKELERLTLADGLDYANAKMVERYNLAKKRSFRPIRGLEHLAEGGGGE